MASLRSYVVRYPFLADGRFVSAVLGHFAVDLLNSIRPLVLVLLVTRLGLNNTHLGFYAMSATLMAALSQPFFGWLSDHKGGRWFAKLSVFWMGALYALVGLVHHPLIIWGVILAALGSGAFHPQGVMNASQAGGEKRTLATSIFFTGGQLALGLGPTIGGVLLALYGLPILTVLGVLIIPVAFLLWRYVPSTRTEASTESKVAMQEMAQEFGRGRYRWVVIAIFALLVFLRSWGTHSNMTFLPRLLQERGWSEEWQGLALTTYMLSSAFAVVLFGRLADELGRQRILRLGLLLGIVPLYLYPHLSGWHMFVLIALTGATIGGIHSILVVLAQSLIPHRMALASGLVLGFMFASGGIGQMLTGIIADHIGTPNALTFLALPIGGAFILSLSLPSAPKRLSREQTA